MNSVLNYMLGLAVGAVIGAGVVLLVAPKSGDELQQGVRDRVSEAIAEGRAARRAKQAELERQAGIRHSVPS